MLTDITPETLTALITTERRNGNKEFIVTNTDGTKKKMRLFVSTTGQIGYHPPRTRRRGYALSIYGLKSVEPVRRRPEKSMTEKFAVHARKLADMLTASGLWSNILTELKESSFDYDTFYAIKPELAGHIANWNVKRMDFRRKLGCCLYGDNEKDYAEIKRHMDAGVNFSIPSVKGRSYDVSFSFENGLNVRRAWYSEEYRGCGNGHYYLAIDHEHAIYYCKN